MKNNLVKSIAKNLKPLVAVLCILFMTSIGTANNGQLYRLQVETVVPNYNGVIFKAFFATVDMQETYVNTSTVDLNAYASKNLAVGSKIEWKAYSDDAPNPVTIALGIMPNMTGSQNHLPTLTASLFDFGFTHHETIYLTVEIVEPDGTTANSQPHEVYMTYIN